MSKTRTITVIDDVYNQEVDDFILDIIEKYKLRDNCTSEMRSRPVCISSTSSPVVSDNHLTEIVADDKLVALIYYRRTEFNWTEITMIDLETIKTN